ncbi:MAG: 23S rRNA (guanosine(2251)-2'-O)-methyltransferase RlmB [Syntrophobacterales bacterium]|nr:23S rRNA (guanosine(2251)-2'-O)-methyltransferase RlmB [Syntrophobacterales bacterium]
MQVIYGVKPVMETILHGRRKVEKIILATGRDSPGIRKIMKLAAQEKISVYYNNKNYLTNITGSKSHQGIICVCNDYEYTGVDEIIANCHGSMEHGLVLILDGIEDPQNLGSIIRTAYCFGVNGIIIPENRSASVTPAVIKVSAGAAQHILIARVVNISRTIDYLKEKGFWIYGADVSSDQNFSSLDYRGQVGLVMGSEGRGIRSLVKKKCDRLVSITMSGEIDSLNVSVATGIILYEIWRNRAKY